MTKEEIDKYVERAIEISRKHKKDVGRILDTLISCFPDTAEEEGREPNEDRGLNS